MERIPVESSNVESVGYDDEDQILEVEFKSGEIYHYFDVPEGYFEGLVSARSVGGYLAEEIKGVYDYHKQ